jgi:hypothetical protein
MVIWAVILKIKVHGILEFTYILEAVLQRGGLLSKANKAITSTNVSTHRGF